MKTKKNLYFFEDNGYGRLRTNTKTPKEGANILKKSNN